MTIEVTTADGIYSLTIPDLAIINAIVTNLPGVVKGHQLPDDMLLWSKDSCLGKAFQHTYQSISLGKKSRL